MSIESNVEIGTIAIVKVGCNEIEVTVTAVLEDGWNVKSNSSGREFKVRTFEQIINENQVAQPKKLSLLNAAAKALEIANSPLNAKELIAKSIELNLWENNGAKTPEQTLYSAITREIKTKETPRFRKSETRKGSFEFNN